MNRRVIISATETMKSAKEIVSKKFMFHNSKITQLKAMAAVQGVNNSTAMEVIGALISKRSIASTTQNLGSIRPPSSLFNFARASPKLAPRSSETCVHDLRALSEQIKKKNTELKGSLEQIQISRRNNYVLNYMSSGDSIEVVVSLEKGSMATLESDKQLLQFASLEQSSM